MQGASIIFLVLSLILCVSCDGQERKKLTSAEAKVFLTQVLHPALRRIASHQLPEVREVMAGIAQYKSRNILQFQSCTFVSEQGGVSQAEAHSPDRGKTFKIRLYLPALKAEYERLAREGYGKQFDNELAAILYHEWQHVRDVNQWQGKKSILQSELDAWEAECKLVMRMTMIGLLSRAWPEQDTSDALIFQLYAKNDPRWKDVVKQYCLPS